MRDGRDDFRMEKDKCTMQDFLVRNRIPMAGVLGTWRINASAWRGKHRRGAEEQLLDAVVDEFASGRIFDRNPEAAQPFYLKCCHLTQGSAESVTHFRREEITNSEAKRAELRRWLRGKMDFVIDDYER
eukprot:2625549-Prymnesium_polylepis.1